MMSKVVIIGGGPCGLFTAWQLIRNSDHQVQLYDKKSSPGNKFLVAGKSGLNLTHSQDRDEFASNYYEDNGQFLAWLKEFDNKDLIKWANELGIETFVGSSGRVFPKNFKAAKFLKLWMADLKSSKKFEFFPNSTLQSIQDTEKRVIINGQQVKFDKLVLALGGKSWSKTGSDGSWVETLHQLGIKTEPFYPMNCGHEVNWSEPFKKSLEIMPIKYITMSHGNTKVKGDIMVTSWGLEGTPIYSLSNELSKSFSAKKGVVQVEVDLKPDLSLEEVYKKLVGKKSTSTKLKRILSPEAIILLRERTTKDVYLNEKNLAQVIKNLKIELTGPRPIDEAISTGGGVKMCEVDSDLCLVANSSIYIGGEMLAWNAPTGGFLLQGCFTQGFIIAQAIRKKAT